VSETKATARLPGRQSRRIEIEGRANNGVRVKFVYNRRTLLHRRVDCAPSDDAANLGIDRADDLGLTVSGPKEIGRLGKGNATGSGIWQTRVRPMPSALAMSVALGHAAL
jgi:hypothetical protein